MSNHEPTDLHLMLIKFVPSILGDVIVQRDTIDTRNYVVHREITIYVPKESKK